MYKGGDINKSYSDEAFRFAGLFIPAFLILYGVMIQSGIIQSSHIIDNTGLLLFSFWWAYVGVIQFLFKSKGKTDTKLRLIVYHLLTGAYLLFVSGVSSPIALFWILLSLISYKYFSIKGFLYSIISFAAVVSIDILLWFNLSETIVFYDLITFTVILITGSLIVMAIKSNNISKIKNNSNDISESIMRDRFMTIVNNLADAVISTDINGIVNIYNAASLNLLDTNNSLKGIHIDEILPLVDQEAKTVSIFKEFQKTKTLAVYDDLFYVISDDDKIRLEIKISPIHSSFSRTKQAEKHDGYIVIMRDITKSKSLEEERDEFISVISHELRTPITIAEGTISNVQVMMDHPDVTNSMLSDAIKTAHDQILFLASIVNDLSSLSRAEKGLANESEEIDIKELAHGLHGKYVDEAKAKNLQFNLDLSTKFSKVHVNRLYLEELIQNLITNAIKYTKKGNVTVSIKQKNGIIKFSVKDTGIGVSKTDQSKIFNKFYRSEDYRTRESSGTGLGLYIVSKLANKLGTKIELTSRLNFGSTFSFKLPYVEK
ncbi:MAG: ATP-binding protein [Candidatus Saccharibacteria bacterium]